jgi:short-subunit dehydrogenase
MPKKPMSDKVVVVTGASAGVGRAVVWRFARDGAKIALLARDRERLEAVKKEVEELGGEALVLPTDVSRPEQVEFAAELAERELGPVDVWINNAMVSVFSPVAETTPEEYRRVTEVTYLGVVHGTLAALRRMRARNDGVIVQVGSALAYRAIPLQSAYCAAKHAVAGFTESLRVELLHEKSRVQVTIVQLPALNTPQFGWVKSRLPNKAQPVPPIYQPEVAAEAIYQAARRPRREFTVGWPAWRAIVGDKLVPGLADRYLARFGYESQQTDEPENPNRPHNLWESVPGDAGAHGDFDHRARLRSTHLWATLHRRTLGAAALGLGAAAWYFRRKRASSNGKQKP